MKGIGINKQRENEWEATVREITTDGINEVLEEWLVTNANLDQIYFALTDSPFDTPEQYNINLAECGRLIAEEDWLALGKLIGEPALDWLKSEARQELIDRSI